MKRVVITGMGIISPLGINNQEVLNSLKKNRSGIVKNKEFEDMNMKSIVSGKIQIDRLNIDSIPREVKRFSTVATQYAYLAFKEAIQDSELSIEQYQHNPRCGIVAGTGGSAPLEAYESIKKFVNNGLKKVGPFYVPKIMSNSISALLATSYKIAGVNYTITSACATSTHCIGNAFEQIQLGKQDIIFAGGAEYDHWSISFTFDAMSALSKNYNQNPSQSSRPFDNNRDGFVIGGGAGIIVLEEYDHAIKRNAPIYAELISYAANSDGNDMVAPSGKGSELCMKLAISNSSKKLDKIDYINAHATSTPVGDISECNAIYKTFNNSNIPYISSTKSLTGHALGACGVHETIYTLMMMKNDFICGTKNVDIIDNNIPQEIQNRIVKSNINNIPIKTALSNNFGFGGTNATLIFSKNNI